MHTSLHTQERARAHTQAHTCLIFWIYLNFNYKTEKKSFCHENVDIVTPVPGPNQ